MVILVWSLKLCVSVGCLQKLQSVRKQYARLRRADTVPRVQKSFLVVQANFELWCALCQAQVKWTGLISDFNDFSCYLSISSLTYDNLVYITGECYMHYWPTWTTMVLIFVSVMGGDKVKNFFNAENDTWKKPRLVVGYIKICALSAISVHWIYSRAILVISCFPYQYLFY